MQNKIIMVSLRV